MKAQLRKLYILTLATLLALPLGPLVEAQKNDKFADTATVLVVEVPVNVTVNGEPVRGLTAANFEVLEGRRTQPIVGFEVVDLATVTTGAVGKVAMQPIAPAARRHILLLFDISFSEPSALLRARESAVEMVQTDLHPQDLVAVATYSVTLGPKLVLNFTGDRAQMLLALEGLGMPDGGRGASDPLSLVLGSSSAGSVGNIQASEGRKSSAEAVSSYLDDQYRLTDRAETAELQNRVTRLTRSLGEFGRMMDRVDGRKYVVLLSEGIDDNLLVGSGGAAGRRGGSGGGDIGDTDAANSSTPSASAAIIDGGEALAGVSTDEMFGSGKTQNDLQKMLTAFKQANCIIQAVDVGGLRAGGSVRASKSGTNSLTMMASETGGQFFNNFNDLSQALDRILKQTSVTYVLAVQPEKVVADGNYHRFKVRLKDGPKGADLQHRPGFYAPLPINKQSKEERQLAAAQELMSQEGGRLETAVHASPFYRPGNKAYVPVLIEANGPSLLSGLKSPMLPLEFYAYAMDANGAVHDFFAQTLGVDTKQAGQTLAGTGIKYYGHLDLDPGEYSVRVLVRNLETGASALRILPLSIPDFAKASPYLAAPSFPEALGKWVMVREPQERQGTFFPFVKSGEPFLPAGSPKMAAKGDLELPVPAFHLGKGPFVAVARLVSSTGETRPLEVLKMERQPTSVAGAEMLVVSLKSNGAAAGKYDLQLELTDQGSGKSLTSSTRVEVGG